jgi:hypothetical protein
LFVFAFAEIPASDSTYSKFFSFSFCIIINAFQSPSAQNQGFYDMLALQQWLKFDAIAQHKSEKS